MRVWACWHLPPLASKKLQTWRSTWPPLVLQAPVAMLGHLARLNRRQMSSAAAAAGVGLGPLEPWGAGPPEGGAGFPFPFLVCCLWPLDPPEPEEVLGVG